MVFIILVRLTTGLFCTIRHCKKRLSKNSINLYFPHLPAGKQGLAQILALIFAEVISWRLALCENLRIPACRSVYACAEASA
jgi:hypothetical protein